VAGEDHAAALFAQAAQEFAQAAGGHHVEAVGRLVEDDVLRVVHQGARDRGLGALALREALGLAVEDLVHVQRRASARCARDLASSMPCRRPK
jgi:hypothetical protein